MKLTVCSETINELQSELLKKTTNATFLFLAISRRAVSHFIWIIAKTLAQDAGQDNALKVLSLDFFVQHKENTSKKETDFSVTGNSEV